MVIQKRVGEEVKVKLRGGDGCGSIGKKIIKLLLTVAIIHMHINIMFHSPIVNSMVTLSTVSVHVMLSPL